MQELEQNEPDITVNDKKNNECLLVECLADSIRISRKLKRLNHRNTKLLKKTWDCKSVKTIPIIFGALGTVNIKLREWFKSIDIN